MSSSTKKQLRREQVAAVKAQRQQDASKESKKIKLYTSIFCVVLALMVLLVAVIGVNNSGLIEPRLTAVKVGDTEISASELNVYYINEILDFYDSVGSYMALYGLKTDASLNTQVSMDTVNTWDNYFLASAMKSLHSCYSIYNAALADSSYTEVENTRANVQDTIKLMQEAYANSGSNLNDTLYTRYGKGVNEDVYHNMMFISTVAGEYYNHYVNSLTYTADQLAAKDAEDPIANNLYNYSHYVLYVSDFQEGGTEDENGNVTYTDEETAAALAACEAAAKALTDAGYTTSDALKAAGDKLAIHNNEGVLSTLLTKEDMRSADIANNLRDWVIDSSRQVGDIAYLERESTINGETSVSGYDVIIFEGINDNRYPLVNVRHILVSFEGGTTDETTGAVTYSDDEKAAAKAAAQEIYDTWLAGNANAESFAALATEKSTDSGSVDNGGLYTDVYPGQMVTAFNDWCFAEGRQIGDHGLIETEYGYHIIFLDGFSETTYRDYIITTDMKNADIAAWQEALLEQYPLTEVNLSRVDRTLVLGNYLYYGYGY